MGCDPNIGGALCGPQLRGGIVFIAVRRSAQ